MTRVRSGQARPGPWSLAGVSIEVSGVRRDFACTSAGLLPPVLVALRSQSRWRREGRTRTLSGPSPDLSPASARAHSIRYDSAPALSNPAAAGSYSFTWAVAGRVGSGSFPAWVVPFRLCRPGCRAPLSRLPDSLAKAGVALADGDGTRVCGAQSRALQVSRVKREASERLTSVLTTPVTARR